MIQPHRTRRIVVMAISLSLALLAMFFLNPWSEWKVYGAEAKTVHVGGAKSGVWGMGRGRRVPLQSRDGHLGVARLSRMRLSIAAVLAILIFVIPALGYIH